MAIRRLLVDTHALLWFLYDDPQLSETAGELLSDARVAKVVSVVSLWEIATKVATGKLKLGMSYAVFQSQHVAGRDLEILAVGLQHLVSYSSLPLHHRDPFDRLIIAQAEIEGLPVLTRDTNFASYPVTVVW